MICMYEMGWNRNACEGNAANVCTDNVERDIMYVVF